MWNVKLNSKIATELAGQRFNRDIVECKVVQWVHVHEAGGDLIETLWNVKIGADAGKLFSTGI